VRAALVVIVAACGGSPATPATPTAAPTPVAPAPAASTACYAGSAETTLAANGQVVDKFEAVAKRTLDPSTSTIREEVAMGGSRPGRYKVTMVVTGSKLTMKEDGGAFTGEGDLVGTPWAWSSWTSRATMEGGIKVTSTDTVDGDKLEARKTVEQGGQVIVTIVERFTALPCDQFEARATALVPAK
jgi:hypothetical protein